MSYQSPIELITTQAELAVENEVVRAVQRIGVNVDKEELMRALTHHSNQYAKGYNDRENELVRCKDCRYGESTTNILGEDRVKCNLSDSFVYKDITLPPDWYCADAERKGNDND